MSRLTDSEMNAASQALINWLKSQELSPVTSISLLIGTAADILANGTSTRNKLDANIKLINDQFRVFALDIWNELHE